MSRHRISEAETRKELIDPQLEKVGWSTCATNIDAAFLVSSNTIKKLMDKKVVRI